jgi:hypothetical protein
MDLCRTKGVISFKGNGLEMLFGPPPPKPGAKVESDPRASKREHYNILLGRLHSDAELDELP